MHFVSFTTSSAVFLLSGVSVVAWGLQCTLTYSPRLRSLHVECGNTADSHLRLLRLSLPSPCDAHFTSTCITTPGHIISIFMELEQPPFRNLTDGKVTVCLTSCRAGLFFPWCRPSFPSGQFSSPKGTPLPLVTTQVCC